MERNQKHSLAIFYCQNVPESSDYDRQVLEKEHGKVVRLYPIPCAGRLDYVHLLRALEEFADAVYVIACPEDACKYFEGNRRAVKRIQRAQSIIESIGLERERLEIIIGSNDDRWTLKQHAEEILESIKELSPSPVHE